LLRVWDPARVPSLLQGASPTPTTGAYIISVRPGVPAADTGGVVSVYYFMGR
jgi:hypothetical protein